MYKKLRRSGAFILTLMYTLVFNMSGVFVYAQERSEESSGYTLSIQYNDDNTEAIIHGNMENISEDIRIIELQDSSGNELDFSNLNYKVLENGDYEFHITYEKTTEIPVKATEESEVSIDTLTEEKKETINIKVDGIKRLDAELSSGYKLNVTYSSDKKEATIQGDISKVPEDIRILKIKDNSGNELDFSNLNYKVLKNGNYDFYITYERVVKLSETNVESVAEQKEETISINVDGIKQDDNESVESEVYAGNSDLVINASEVDSKEQSIYVLNISVPMYQVEKNHIIKLTLPKDVVITSDFKSELIESVSKETNGVENVYSLKFKDSVITGSPTSIKLGIGIEQKEYLSYSDSERYTIKVIYQADGKQKSEASLDIDGGTYRKVTDFQYVSSENTLLGDYQIKEIKFKLFKDLQTQKLVNPLKIKVKKHVDLEYNLDSSWQVEGEYFVRTFDFNAGVINDNMIEFTIPFRAKVKDDIIGKKYKTARTDVNSVDDQKYEWKHEIETDVSLSFGLKEQVFKTPIAYSVLIFGPGLFNTVFISNANIVSEKRYDQIAGENNINYLSGSYDYYDSGYWEGASIFPIQSGRRYSNSNGSKELIADKQPILSSIDRNKLKITVEIILPSNIEWTGDPALYDSNTRKVTISQSGYYLYNRSLKVKFSGNSTMKIKNVQNTGFKNEVIESLPIKVRAEYKGYELEPYIGNWDLKSRSINVKTEHESVNAIQIGKSNRVAYYDISYREFMMDYNKPVDAIFNISDQYADLKQITLSSSFMQYLDKVYGEDWSIEYSYRSGDMNSSYNKTTSGKTNKITAPAGSRITQFRIKGKRVNRFNKTTIKNGIEFTFDVLKNDRKTGSPITEKEEIEVSNFHNYDLTFTSISNTNIKRNIKLYRIQEKAILTFSEYNIAAGAYEGTTIYGGVYIESNTSGITKPYSPSEDSIEFSFLNTDKIRAKDIWVSLSNGSAQPVVVEYDTNKKTNQTTQKDTTKYDSFNAGTGKFDLQLDEDEYLTRIKVTTNSYFTNNVDKVFLEGIGIKYDVLDTDYITHDTGRKSIQTIRMHATEGNHIYIPEDFADEIVLNPKTLSIISGVDSYESEMTSSNDTASIDNPFNISLSINKLQTGFLYSGVGDYIANFNTVDTYLNYDPFKEPGYTIQDSTLTLQRLKYMIVNPIIYIPVPDGFNFTENSVRIKSGKYAGKTPESEIVKGENGKRYIRVRFYGNESDNTSLYIDEYGANEEVLNKHGFKNYVNYFTNIDLEYELIPTGLVGSGNHSLKSGDIFIDWITGYESYLKQEYGSDIKVRYHGITRPVSITIDGKEIEVISDTIKNNEQIPVVTGSSVAVDILMEKNGQYFKRTNLFGGEQISLISVINNNSSTSLNDINLYIPIKKGVNGSNYQWSMELLEKATANKGTVYYSTATNPTMNGNGDTGYTTSVSDWSKVTMIKVTIPSLASKESLRISAPITNEEKTTKGTLSNEVKIYYQYSNSDGSKVNSSTTDTHLELKDNILTGKVWKDSNMNGVMDANESGVSGADVTLWHNNNGVPEKRDTVTTKADGIYSIEKPEIHNGDYLEITLPDGYKLVPEKVGTYPDSIVSHYDRTNRKLMLQQGETENLNAGVYEEQKIITQKDEYNVKIQGSDSIGATYSPDQPKQLLKYIVPEGYRDALSVDSNGEMTGFKVANDIKVEIYYINAFGDRISKEITVNVVNDNPPTLTVPEVLEFNIGDTFDPRDPQIIKGLSVSDDFDNITLDNIEITEDVPRDGKFLWLFTTNKTNSLNKVGTYEVLYHVEDTAGNVVEKTLKVKVNGIPYFENDNGDEYNKQNPVSTMYLRARETNFERYKDIHAYYEKASDVIGEKAVKTEIQNVQNYPAQDKGEFTLSKLVNVNDKDNPLNNINDAGKYEATYLARTPNGATATITRDVYVRGNPTTTAHSIALTVPRNDHGGHDTWEEFFQHHGQDVDLTMSVEVVDEQGRVTTESFKDMSYFNILTNISDIDFDNIQAGDSVEVRYAAIDNPGNYKEKRINGSFIINFLDKIGEAPHIKLPKQYDNERLVTDKILVNGNEIKSNLINALIEETKMFDVDDKGNEYTEAPNMNAPIGERYGIQRKGIKEINRVEQDGRKTLIYQESDGNGTDVDDKLRSEMYGKLGQYSIVYYTVDGDDNRIDRERIIQIASETRFVKEVGSNPGVNDIKLTPENYRKSDNSQFATGVVAYHIDSDGNVHKMPALPNKELNLSEVGMQEITFSSEHHYNIIPGTNGKKRAVDSITNKYFVHGEISFTKLNDLTVFIGTEVNLLDGVEAIFDKVNTNGVIESVKAAIDTNISGNKLVSHAPVEQQVFYTATDNITGLVQGSSITGSRKIKFIGLPEIHSVDSIEVKTGATEEEIKKLIKADASIDLVDTIENLKKDIQYDFSKIDNNIVTLSVSYELNGVTKTTQKEVRINFMNGPTIVTNNSVLEMSVGEEFNEIDTPGIDLILGDDKSLTKDSITYKSNVPLANGGKLSKAGTYNIKYQVSDKYGNISTLDIKVKVDSIPEIEDKEIHERVGNIFALEDKVSAKYLEAQDTGSPTQTITKVKVKEIRDMEGNIITADLLNKVGKYTIVYEAVNSNNGRSEAERSLYLHGQVVAETNDLYIRKTDSDESSIYDIEKLFNEGYVSASVQYVEVDGAINKVSLDYNNMKIINSNFDTSVVGDNIIQIEVVDDKEPMAKTAATINVHVIDGLGDITITANSDVKVKTGTSEAEVKDVIQARAVQKVPISVDPSGEIDVTQLIQYDFTNYNPNSSDTYEVNLSVDSNGITSQKAINVYVDEIPVFRVDEKVYVVGDEFEELADITVEDKEDKIIDSKNINVIRSNVNMKIPDDYEIEYEVTDSIGNVARLVRVVHVINDELGYLTYSKSLFLTDNNGNVVENGQDVSEQYAGAKGFVRFDNKNDSKVMNIKVTVNSDLEIQNSSKSESYKVGMYDIQGNKLNINNMSLIEVGTLSEQNNLIEYWMNILKQDRMKKELFEGTATFNFTYER